MRRFWDTGMLGILVVVVVVGDDGWMDRWREREREREFLELTQMRFRKTKGESTMGDRYDYLPLPYLVDRKKVKR